MTGDIAVVGGILGITGMFAFFAIKLREGDAESFGNKLSMLFFTVSILFLNLLMYTILLITQNDISISYLADPVMSIGLTIMTYGTIGVFIIYVCYLFIVLLKAVYEWVMGYSKGRTKE